MNDDALRDSVPPDWDRLAERTADTPAAPHLGAGPSQPPPPLLTTVAASWGDALAVLAVCTAELAAVHALGYGFEPGVLGWAGLAALVWWFLASAALLAVRQGTAGMLMAGVVFADHLQPRRIPGVLTVAAASALVAGLPGVLGPRRHPLAVVAGSPIVHAGILDLGDRPAITRGV